MKKTILFVLVLALGLAAEVVKATVANQAPIADAGWSRYAAHDPIVLDGTASYDPDSSGPLSYAWRQIDGPAVVITDANTATPTLGGSTETGTGRDPVATVGGLPQTDSIGVCEFELVVSDGELTSVPDTVIVTIVPDFGATTLRLANPPFDADKPTMIYFGGGDCVTGLAVDAASPFSSAAWLSRANIINFPTGYTPDRGGGGRTYYRYADMIIAYLSAAAPNYNQPIQTSGWSTGGQPAVDVGIHLNLSYADARYAINRVTFVDATTYCRASYSESLSTFLGSSVDGEQCWADAYVSTMSGQGYQYPPFHENVLNVWFPSATGGWFQRHVLAKSWYAASLTGNDMNKFNHGVVAGAYWSVIGPGKNLQLASTPGVQTYRFDWNGSYSSGYMDFSDEAQHPGRLPEPVTLLSWRNDHEPDGMVLSCKPSENAIGYELLVGTDPHHVLDYDVISDTPYPPVESLSELPLEETWWTVRARDRYGSTIYADPIRLDASDLSELRVENLTIGQKYGSVEVALCLAESGDEIVIAPGRYLEDIDFREEGVIVRSEAPRDPNIVATTIIVGDGEGPAVTFSSGKDSKCLLDGLTIAGGAVGISCRDALPTISNCTIGGTGDVAIEYWPGCEPAIVDCNILGMLASKLDDRTVVAYWPLDETEGVTVRDSAGDNDGMLLGDPVWNPEGGMVGGALGFDGLDDCIVIDDGVLNPADGPFSVLAWIKGGAPGQAIISQVDGANWLMAEALEGTLATGLIPPVRRTPVGPLVSDTAITDGDWHRAAFVWDGTTRSLYVDGTLVAQDEQNSLAGCPGGLHIGCGMDMAPGTFWQGRIDDVRIYNRAIAP